MRQLQSPRMGIFTQDPRFADWWNGEPSTVGFFDGLVLPVVYQGEEEASANHLPDTIEAAATAFLTLTPADRLAISDLVLADCRLALEATDYGEDMSRLENITDPADVWRFVRPRELYLERRHRRDRDAYVSIACECDWEDEHGLQLVFRQGRRITRVSSQDGHLTEADAYDRPDAEDKLLSAFA